MTCEMGTNPGLKTEEGLAQREDPINGQREPEHGSQEAHSQYLVE